MVFLQTALVLVEVYLSFLMNCDYQHLLVTVICILLKITLEIHVQVVKDLRTSNFNVIIR
jgi:hypothetical protein